MEEMTLQVTECSARLCILESARKTRYRERKNVSTSEENQEKRGGEWLVTVHGAGLSVQLTGRDLAYSSLGGTWHHGAVCVIS